VKAKLAKKLVSSLAASAVLVSVFAACDLGLTPYVAAADSGPQTIVDAGNTVIDTGTVDSGSDAGDGGDAGTGPKRVFITSTTFGGDFGGQHGQAGADAICQGLATARFGASRFVAWISESVGAKDAIDHLADVGPWYLTDRRTLIFANKAAIVTGPLRGINLDETGANVSTADRVWTGTLLSGRVGGASNATCTDWTITGIAANTTGISGTVASERTGDWTQAFSEQCFNRNHIYCFEQ